MKYLGSELHIYLATVCSERTLSYETVSQGNGSHFWELICLLAVYLENSVVRKFSYEIVKEIDHT